jgi:hypothetical protein
MFGFKTRAARLFESWRLAKRLVRKSDSGGEALSKRDLDHLAMRIGQEVRNLPNPYPRFSRLNETKKELNRKVDEMNLLRDASAPEWLLYDEETGERFIDVRGAFIANIALLRIRFNEDTQQAEVQGLYGHKNEESE